jgi:hypothetical protein
LRNQEADNMKKTFVAVLMAALFGLFSMPALQAAPNNGWAVGSALKANSATTNVRWRGWRRRRRRRRRCYWVHYRRSRSRMRCRGWW